MTDTSKLESARAAREARDSVASRAEGATTAAVASAMRRYLSAEQYHELREVEPSADEQEPTDDAD